MPRQNNKPKLLVIFGPTSSGKTRLAVKLASKFNGEIVSADSRQVYQGMDVGTGKDLQDYCLEFPITNNQLPNKFQIFSRSGVAMTNFKFQTISKIIKVPYHLIDVVSPKKRFNLADYQKLAFKAIDDILKRGKLPILVGGSGLYLQAVVDNYRTLDTKPNLLLRKKLEKLDLDKLFSMLKKRAPGFAGRINTSDKKNKRRLIRYLEILRQGSIKLRTGGRIYQSLLIGIIISPKELKNRISKRLIDRLEKQDMVGEVRRLRRQGLSWKRLENFGLEYKFVSQYLQGKIDYQLMIELLNTAIGQFAKRQMTWFRRWERQGTKINWLRNEKQAEKLVKNFINNF